MDEEVGCPLIGLRVKGADSKIARGGEPARLTPRAGEICFYWVRVGLLSLCSQVLLLPLGVRSVLAPAWEAGGYKLLEREARVED